MTHAIPTVALVMTYKSKILQGDRGQGKKEEVVSKLFSENILEVWILLTYNHIVC